MYIEPVSMGSAVFHAVMSEMPHEDAQEDTERVAPLVDVTMDEVFVAKVCIESSPPTRSRPDCSVRPAPLRSSLESRQT